MNTKYFQSIDRLYFDRSDFYVCISLKHFYVKKEPEQMVIFSFRTEKFLNGLKKRVKAI